MTDLDILYEEVFGDDEYIITEKIHEGYNEDIPRSVYNRIKGIYNSLSEKERYYLGDCSISKYTVYAKEEDEAYIIVDDYLGRFRRAHPYKGKIISIAASKRARGKNITDKLIQELIKEHPRWKLIAEIDEKNKYSKRLFIRNNFKYIGKKDGILYYEYKKR